MATQSSIVPNALSYYDKVNHNYRPLFRKIGSYRYQTSTDPNIPNNISFYDRDNNLLGSSNYQILGVYSRQHRMWAWAWSIPSHSAKTINLSRKLLTYGLDNEDANIRSELVTSRFAVAHPMNLDIHLAIASYLTRHVMYAAYVYPDASDRTNYIINYIFLTDFNAAKAPSSWDEIREHAEKNTTSLRHEGRGGSIKNKNESLIHKLFKLAMKGGQTITEDKEREFLINIRTKIKELKIDDMGFYSKYEIITKKELAYITDREEFIYDKEGNEIGKFPGYYLITGVLPIAQDLSSLLFKAHHIGRYMALLPKKERDPIFHKKNFDKLETYLTDETIRDINGGFMRIPTINDLIIFYNKMLEEYSGKNTTSPRHEEKGGGSLVSLLFDDVLKASKIFRENDAKGDGRGFWSPIKDIASRVDNLSNFKWQDEHVSNEFAKNIMALPEHDSSGKTIEHNHFLIQLVRIPKTEEGNLRKLLQIALNAGQYLGISNTQTIQDGKLDSVGTYVSSDVIATLDAILAKNPDIVEDVQQYLENV
jgi:hypothetical protein